MKLEEIAKEINNIPKEQQDSILKLIDIKITDDMETVINRLDGIEKRFEEKLNNFKWTVGIIVAIVGGIIATIVGLFFK